MKCARDISSAKFTTISRQVYSDLLLGVSDAICQRAIMDKSGMIRTEMGMHNKSENDRSA
jgi:hypothetical protein